MSEAIPPPRGTNTPVVRDPRVEQPTVPPDKKAEKCTLPPDGWECSRESGHEGPCAASPKADIRSALQKSEELRRKSGEMLLALRSSDIPPDPIQARIDQWGEVFLVRIEETAVAASVAKATANRASRDNEDQNGAIGVIVSDVAVIKAETKANGAAIEALKADNALGAKLAGDAVDAVKKLGGVLSPQVASFLSAGLTIAAGAVVTWMRSKGWLP